jgi:hypothetical protein
MRIPLARGGGRVGGGEGLRGAGRGVAERKYESMLSLVKPLFRSLAYALMQYLFIEQFSCRLFHSR